MLCSLTDFDSRCFLLLWIQKTSDFTLRRAKADLNFEECATACAHHPIQSVCVEKLSTSAGICAPVPLAHCLSMTEGLDLIRSWTTQTFRGELVGNPGPFPKRNLLPRKSPSSLPAPPLWPQLVLLPFYHLLRFHKMCCLQPEKDRGVRWVLLWPWCSQRPQEAS